MKSMLLLFLLAFFSGDSSLETQDFYAVLAGKDKAEFATTIARLEKQPTTPLRNAYKGALIAKSASFEKMVAKKVKTFKAGVQLLETEIKKDPDQVEFRFLRLSIQENCPKILKYNTHIQVDVAAIELGYHQLDATLKKVIFKYAQKSSVLNSENLK